MMKTVNHQQALAQLDALFVGEPCASPLALREHLRGCVECREVFEEMAALDRALHEHDMNDVEPGEFERRYTAAVMEAMIVAPEVVDAEARRRPWWRALWSGWRPAAVLVAALALTALWLPELASTHADRGDALHGGRPGSAPGELADEGFASRVGAGAAAEPRRQAHAGVHHAEIFCARRVDGRTIFNSAERGVLRCALDAELKFAFINEAQGDSAPLPHLALVGRHQDGHLLWYHPVLPLAPGHASARVGQADRLEPLGETIRLGINHKPGRVQVFAVFSAMPLPRSAIEARLVDSTELNLDGVTVFDEGGRGAVLGSSRGGEYVVVRRVLHVEASTRGGRGGAQ